jgi:glycosyltransferase involved in cell wall biosynthesis
VHIDHVLVDGGSKDGTVEIARRFDSRVVVNTDDRGMYDAVNRGLGDTTDTSKAAWRRADGEDLADKVGNAGDDIRRDVTGRP